MTIQTLQRTPVLPVLCLLTGLLLPLHCYALFDWLNGDEKVLWHFDNEQYVRLEPQVQASVPNQHPVQLSAEQIRAALGSLKARRNEDTFSVFTPQELDIISEPIAKGLAQASASEDVTFAVIGMHPGLLALESRVTSGRIFFQNQQLQIVFSLMHEEIDYRADRRLHPFLPGTRADINQFDRQLLVSSGQTLIDKREDWVAMDINTVLESVARLESMAPDQLVTETDRLTEEVSVLRQEVQTLKQQPGAASATTADAPGMQQLSQDVSQLRQEVRALRQQRPAADLPVSTDATLGYDALLKQAKERLQATKALYDQGLISEDEYHQKRQQILDEI